MTDEELLSVIFYDGAYGPTLRIRADNTRGLGLLESLFERLASNAPVVINLAEVEGIGLENVRSFELETRQVDRWTRHLTLAEEDISGELRVQWVCTQSEWEDHLLRLKPLIDEAEPGHQYFTDEDLDDALVEVALMEDV